jgi:hypothetical protein
MSVYSLSVADKGVFNLPKEVQTIDVDTRNAYNSTIIGLEAGANNQGTLNVIMGYRAGNSTLSGGQNVYIGSEAAERGRTATDNVIIGYRAGKFITSGVRNVYLGNNTGFFLNGNQNVLIGFNNTFAGDLTLSHSNISIGYRSSTFGNNNVVLGNNSYMLSDGSIGIGERVVDTTANSIIIGNNITNTGSNVLIINNRHNSNLDAIAMSNAENDYLNINDYIVVGNSNNKRVMTIANETIKILASNVELGGAGGLRIGEVVELSGFYSTLLLDRSVTLGIKRDNNPNAPELHMTSNTVFLGGSNVNETYVYGSNSSLYLNSNLIVLSNNDMRFISNSNVIGIGGSNNKEFKLYGSNNTITMSNGGTFLESGLVVYRDAYMSNNLYVNKTSTFKDDVGFFDVVVAHSNVTFERDIIINSNSVMFVGSEVTLCNQDRFIIDGDGETHIQQPLVTKDDVYVEDNITFCNLPMNFVNWDNVNERELQEFYGSSIVQKNLFVGGMMYSAGLNVSDRLVLLSGNGTNQWNQYVSITSNQNPYLVFQSDTGTVVKLGDDFTPELFNFTGKHRCSSSIDVNARQDDLIGKIVIATGRYVNLDNEACIDIDEAIPVIELATRAHDTRAFGVISGFETDDDKRVYRLGNLHFETNKSIDDKKVIVNSVGEGGIWVCNANGPLRNGDLIVTSHLSGFGMRQDDDIVRSCTVAKITCDCDFVQNHDDCQWQPRYKTVVIDNEKEYIVAFVGCTYKF